VPRTPDLAIICTPPEQAPRVVRECGEAGVLGLIIMTAGFRETGDAILIADAWQQKEMGSILTDYCLEIAKKWNLKRIVAQTTTDNSRMISVFRKRGSRSPSERILRWR